MAYEDLTVKPGPNGTLLPTAPVGAPSLPTPTTASPTTTSTPLKATAAVVSQGSTPVTQDLSSTYALKNGTVINKITKAALDLNAFKKETGIDNPNWSALKFDTTYDPAAQTDLLNAGQDAAMAVLSSTPTKDITEAQGLVKDAQDKIAADRAAAEKIGTGEQDLRTQTENYYEKFGIQKIQSDIEAAQGEYDAINLQSLDNLSQREQEGVGTGRTEDFAKNLNSQDQRTIAIKQYAAATKLKSLQDKLNSTIDVFKVFVGQADQQQNNEIQKLSTQIGIDQNALSTGVNLLNAAKDEAKGDEKEAKQMIIDLAKAGVYDSLSSSDKQAISNNQITPTILAAVGTAANQVQQQSVIKDLATKYPDAGITLNDSLATAQSKLNNSAIYREQVRPPSNSTMSTDEKNAAIAVSLYSPTVDSLLAQGATPEQAAIDAAYKAEQDGQQLSLSDRNGLLTYARQKSSINKKSENKEEVKTEKKQSAPDYTKINTGASPAAGSFSTVANGISSFFGNFSLDSTGNIKKQ